MKNLSAVMFAMVFSVVLAGAAQTSAGVAGKWVVAIDSDPAGLRRVLDLKTEGTTVSGTLTTGFFAGSTFQVLQTATATGKFVDGILSAETEDGFFLAQLKDDTLIGTYVYQPGRIGIYKTGWTAKRSN